jgi:hypothetical protein
METFLIALLFFGAFTILMAVGVIFARKPLKGSCGGLSALSDKTGTPPLCEICGEDPRLKTEPCNLERDAEEKAEAAS